MGYATASFRARLAGALIVAAAAGSTAAAAETVVLAPAKDNTLFESGTGDRSNGSGEWLFAGTTARDRLRRALLSFDVAGAVPDGATITGATLLLRMTRSLAGAEPVSLFRVATDWGEGASDAPGPEGAGTAAAPGDATWLHAFFPDAPWSAPGGDFAATPSATTQVAGAASYVWGSTPEMVADVQGWLDEPAGNFGWILIGNERRTVTAKRFGSRERSVGAERPQLVVEFVPPFAMRRFDVRLASLTWDGPGADRYRVVVEFALDPASDGIDPAVEEVVLAFGPHRESLPPGAFACSAGICELAAAGPGVTAAVLTARGAAFRVTGVDLSGAENPIEVSLRVGNDVGSALGRLRGTLRLDDRPSVDRRGGGSPRDPASDP